MHNAKRFLTCGVDSTIPLELQMFLWECVERMPIPRDYLQVFELKPVEYYRPLHTALKSLLTRWNMLFL
jgi:hypothetical protein